MTRRRLSPTERIRLLTLHGGICTFCGDKIDGVRESWDISHDVPLELGGADDDENRKPAHRTCHRKRTAEVDIPQVAKAKRVERKHIGAHRSRNPLPFGRGSKLKRKINGEVVPR